MTPVLRNGLVALGLGLSMAIPAPAHAGSNAAIDALRNTPVSVFTYGLAALDESIGAYVGSGGRPAPSAVFKDPLSGPIADIATTLFDADAETVTINLVRIADINSASTPAEACQQAFASLHLFAAIDPATGKLSDGMTESVLTSFFTAAGTATKPPANDFPTLDQAFRLRYNATMNGKRFRCNAPLFGTDYTLELLP